MLQIDKNKKEVLHMNGKIFSVVNLFEVSNSVVGFTAGKFQSVNRADKNRSFQL